MVELIKVVAGWSAYSAGEMCLQGVLPQSVGLVWLFVHQQDFASHSLPPFETRREFVVPGGGRQA